MVSSSDVKNGDSFLLAEHPEIIRRNPQQLTPAARNARRHSPAQIRQIAESIQRFGFINPILIDPAGIVVAGHGRLEAACQLGLSEVPTLEIRHLSAVELRAYRLADNRLAELSEWDDALLKLEFEDLAALEFDLELTGFDTVEIDKLLFNEAPPQNRADAIQEAPERQYQPVVKPGELWQLGEHRLFCGNALEPASYVSLMAGAKARMVLTDPPYNVRIDGNARGLGQVRHREFAMASGEMSEQAFTTFLSTALEQMAAVSLDGALHFVFMDWRHLKELMQAAEAPYQELKNLIVWVKTNAGMGSFYRSQHELILVGKVGRGRHTNNFALGSRRYRTNVWTYPGANSFGPNRTEDLQDHPTVKPVALLADAIRDCSKHGEIILDGFAGSGSTLLAAEQTGRCGYGIEIDPHYCDVAIRRWQRLTGKSATETSSGKSFQELEPKRRVRLRKRPAGTIATPGEE
jgi:DNA modification methylase